MCLSFLTLTVMPMIAGRAHNPLLTFSTILATLMLLYRIWAATISDAQITAFHFLVNAVNLVKLFKQVCNLPWLPILLADLGRAAGVSFLHTFLLTSTRVGGECPPNRLAPLPPMGNPGSATASKYQ